MNEKLETEILSSLAISPGIIGLSSMDLGKTNRTLPQNELSKGIIVESKSNEVTVSLALVLQEISNASTIISGLHSNIDAMTKKLKLKLVDLIIYVRSVK